MFSPSTLPKIVLLVTLMVVASHAFAPKASVAPTFSRPVPLRSPVVLNIFSEDDKERKALTRDSEPEDFFATNTDKMSDEEKIPIALAGIAFICLPFFAGLIALYSSQ